VTAKEELSDPLGWIVAATAGGLAWAILAVPLGAAAIVVGVGIGAVVLGTKVALGSRGGPERKSLSRGADLPKPPRNSQQAELLQRAGRAFDRLNELSDRADDEWMHQRIGKVDNQAFEVVGSLRELAGRATVLQRSIAAADPEVLRADVSRLSRQIHRTDDVGLQAELKKTLTAVNSQVESVKRLTALNETLLSKMHSAAVGLEGLATRTGELVAMGSDAGVNEERAAQVLGELTSDLDTMRDGLLDAEAATRRVLE
jgi:hypothetical protein